MIYRRNLKAIHSKSIDKPTEFSKIEEFVKRELGILLPGDDCPIVRFQILSLIKQ